MATTKVNSEFIAVNAISGTIIADGAITSTHLAANCVDSSELVTGSIDTIHIAANQVTATKIVTNGVLTRHISDDQVTADKIANATITTTQIASNTIATSNVADNAIDGTKIASNSILTRHIDDDQVTGDQLADALTVVTSVTTPLVDAAIVDGENFKINGAQGSDGQVLTSTGSGVAWEAAATTFESLTDTTVSTSDPATNTNPSTGVGTLWLNKNSGNMWCCTNATSNANIWANLGAGSTSYGSDPTGGTITTAGGYKYHTFTSSGTFAAPLAKSGVDVLIVAGGAAGGGR